jgi:hypothetical protein
LKNDWNSTAHASAMKPGTCPWGKEREEVLKSVRQAETTAGINRWRSTGESDQQLGQHVGKMVQSMCWELRRDQDR